jgi:uncharacterized protein involved in cysteine biosynthesis
MNLDSQPPGPRLGTEHAAARARSASALVEFSAGASAALRGLWLGGSSTQVRRSYRRLTAALLAVGLALDAAGIAAVVHWTAAAPDAAWWLAAGWFALRALGIAAVLLATPLLLLVGAHVGLPLLADGVFFAALSALDPPRARALAARPGTSAWLSALDSLRRLGRFALLTLALLLLALLPLFGPPLAATLQLALTARTLSWELLDPYFGRRGLRLVAQREWVRAHQPRLLGFGALLLPLLAIPLLGPLLLGLAQAAAAQLVHELPRGEDEP